MHNPAMKPTRVYKSDKLIIIIVEQIIVGILSTILIVFSSLKPNIV